MQKEGGSDVSVAVRLSPFGKISTFSIDSTGKQLALAGYVHCLCCCNNKLQFILPFLQISGLFSVENFAFRFSFTTAL